MTEETTDAATRSSKAQWAVALGAVAVAAAPHAFFPPPLHLHMRGHLDGFYGISLWAPAILAGVAFFFGVEMGARCDVDKERWPSGTRATFLVIAFIVYIVALAASFEFYELVPRDVSPTLGFTMLMYGGLWALESIFWQGFLQHRVSTELPSWRRILNGTVLPVLIVLPFGLSDAPVGGMILASALSHFIAATSFELGYRVLVCMAIHGALGVLFIWFQQVLLL